MAKKVTLLFLIAAIGVIGVANGARRLDSQLLETVEYAKEVYAKVLDDGLISKNLYPHTGDPTSDTWNAEEPQWWTAGFFPGVLWMLYRLTVDRKWAEAAMAAQEGIRFRENDTGTHDVGFVIMSSYGLGLQSGFGNEEYLGWKDTVVKAAESLATRFNRNAGVLRSWNGGNPGEMLVIIDNMMNLDLLNQATVYSKNHTYREISMSHADKTIANHFRPDMSTYHVVGYSESDGSVLRKYTVQGYSDGSMWARGQAWAILGLAETYEWLRAPQYLNAASRAAGIFMERLPSDHVPFWDFDATLESGYHPRDTSAATIASYGLLKLYLATGVQYYLTRSEDIIESVLKNYSGRDWPIPAISVNGTVFFNEGNFDTAIIYGDFYLLKYIEQYLKLI